jgi:hypothetical protein
MNTRKTVYTKLFSEKTELGTHEVQLALIDDIQELIKVYESKIVPDYVKIEKQRQELWDKNKKLKEEAKIAYDLWLKTSERKFKVLKEYENLAKQLGINIKDSEPVIKLHQVSEAKEDIARAYKTYDNIAEYFKQF